MNIALIGFPAAGKKTLFSLLTHRTIPPGRRENEPLEGRAAVRDPRVNAIAAVAKPERMKYAETVFVLCPDVQSGAQERTWVEAARRSDLLCPVIRAFSDPSIYHPAGSVSAARDQTDLRMQILLTDLELIEKRLERIGKEKRAGQTPAQLAEEHALMKCKTTIEKEQWPTEALLELPELQAVRSLGLLTLKPLLWTHNVDEQDVKEDGRDPLTIACKIEQEIMGVEDVDERNAFLRELGLSSSGVDRMNRAAYDALGLMSFYTMGKDEVRAWTIRKGTPAPAAAGKIHTDIERGFIRVEIIKYDDLMAAGSEEAIRQHGKLQVKGKDYVIQDGDICNFRFNV